VDPRFLTIDEVLTLHDLQVRLFGGINGVRDPGLLASAIANAEATFEGQLLHATFPEIAAAYLYGICRNHPFLDGNKRTAAATALTFLEMNGVEINADDDALFELVIGVAEGHVPKSAVAEFLAEHGT
jgi:death on curing protein